MVRSSLPKTYYALLARFPQLTEIQRLAIPPLLRGQNALLLAPTASGKTEAFLAPLLERNFEGLRQQQGHLLMVCPTRALVNDAARRLEKPLNQLGLRLCRRTSDHSQDPAQHPAALWITTPEGLDSLLCRHGRWLQSTLALILDEIHQFERSPRGTQVECLLQRLDRICLALGKVAPQRVGATATSARPEALAQRFLGTPGSPNPTVLKAVQLRPLVLHYHRWFDIEQLRKELSQLPRARKVLLFTRSRAEAEEMGASLKGLPPYGAAVFVHHAWLSRPLRLEAEASFLRERSALMCSTSTLEVGVDIGDIDWVVMLHPPEGREVFWQRAGRSGRRGEACRVLGVWRQESERARLRYFAESTAEGLVDSPGCLHQGVVPQQALSLLWQNPRKQLPAEALLERLPERLRSDWNLESLEAVLERLAEKGWLVKGTPHWMPGPRLERAARRGLFHGNIPQSGPEGLEVRDTVTGKVLGSVQPDRQGRLPAQLRLGGRSHRLSTAHKGEELRAAPLPHPELHGKLASSAGGGPAIPLMDSQHFANWLGVGPRCRMSGPQGNLVGHFLGSTWGKLLQRHLQQCFPQSIFYADAYLVAWQGSWQDSLWDENALQSCIQKFSSAVMSELGFSQWHRYLPRALQRQETQAALHWEWIRTGWIASPWKLLSGPEAAPLQQLIPSDNSLPVAGFFPIQAEDL